MGSTIQANWRELIKPKKLLADSDEINEFYGKFVAEPFERGFGITIGNSLRRILLSSIMGAAVTSVKIKDVLHEYTTIPGVVEDVTDILLNIKGIRFKLFDEGPKTVRIDVTGPCVVKAGDAIKILKSSRKGRALNKCK